VTAQPLPACRPSFSRRPPRGTSPHTLRLAAPAATSSRARRPHLFAAAAGDSNILSGQRLQLHLDLLVGGDSNGATTPHGTASGTSFLFLLPLRQSLCWPHPHAAAASPLLTSSSCPGHQHRPQRVLLVEGAAYCGEQPHRSTTGLVTGRRPTASFDRAAHHRRAGRTHRHLNHQRRHARPDYGRHRGGQCPPIVQRDAASSSGARNNTTASSLGATTSRDTPVTSSRTPTR
jgi:hypothetical protein